MRLRTLFAVIGFAVAAAVGAQDYPSRPIRMIVPWPPGGGTDITARVIAAKLTDAWGRQVVVDNRGGATGTIGTSLVARSAADGYTLLLGTNATHAIAVNLLTNLPYDQEKDLIPITRVVSVPHLVSVHPALPARNIAELVALAKAQPGKIAFGSAGSGSTPHLGGELFKMVTGVNLLHVPYKGTGDSLLGMLAGQVMVSFDTMPSVIDHIKNGRLRALAVMGPRRVPVLPEVPTIAEAGAPGAEQVTWYGLFGPGGLPSHIVRKLHGEIVKIVQLPDVKVRFETLGADETTSASPEEFAAMLKADVAKYAKVINAAGLKSE
jgi:tripartite-type tricarboxylate transporter receptor subunit TctC